MVVNAYKKENNAIPALLLLHNRSQYLASQLETLAKSGIREVFVSIDGPRNENEFENQNAIMKILESHMNNFDLMEFNRSQVNMGLGLAIVTGLDWFFERNHSGMIFEDDVYFEKDCLEYFKSGISMLHFRKNILLLGGSNPFPDARDTINTVLTNYPQIWGWATTREKWFTLRHFIFRKPEIEVVLSSRVREFWKTGWRRVNEGYVDTWDTPIAAGMRLSGSLCVLPPVNLTSNQGVDAFAVNTKKSKFPLRMPISTLNSGLNFNLEIPTDTIERLNKKFERKIYKVSYRHSFSHFARIFDKLRFNNPKSYLAAKLGKID